MHIVERERSDLIQAFIRSDINVMAHQVNCFKIAKSGIANEIFTAFPTAYTRYTAPDYTPELGMAQGVGIGNQIIFNLFGQYHHDHSHPDYIINYSGLYRALASMRDALVNGNPNPYLRIGFPRIGCGLAKGNWHIVSGLIEEIFSQTEYEISFHSL